MTCCAHERKHVDREDMHPKEKRSCRDVLWLLLFLIATAGSIYVSFYSIRHGNLNLLRYGISTNNTLCGSGEETGREKLVFCLNPNPIVLASGNNNSYFSVCAPACPTSGSDLEDIYKARSAQFVAATSVPEFVWEFDDYLLVRTMCVGPTVSVMNRCLLDPLHSRVGSILYSQATDPGDDSLAKGSQMLMNTYNDIVTTWYVILVCGIGFGFVVSFIWLQLLRCFAGIIVWVSIILFFFAFIIIDILLAAKSGYLDPIRETSPKSQMQEQYEHYYRILFWIFVVLTIVLFLILFFMINRIRLALALVRESADVMITMPQIIITPLLAIIVMGFVFAYAIFISAYLASCGTISQGTLTYDTHIRHLIVYHGFYCLWVFFIAQGVHSVVLAGAVAQYYWTRDKNTIHLPVLKSIYRTLIFHLGSIAFGSLILTIIRAFRYFVMVLSARIRKYTKNNVCVRLLLCCVNCCLRCLEHFVQFLTKNAYIMIAVDGHSFCTSTVTAWSLLMANVARMTAVNVVTNYLFFISRLAVGIGAAIFTSVWVTTHYMSNDTQSQDTVSSSFGPAVCSFILAHLIAFLFFEVTDFSIDTLLLCFCLDDRRNHETGKYFASERLRKFMEVAPKMDHLVDSEEDNQKHAPKKPL